MKSSILPLLILLLLSGPHLVVTAAPMPRSATTKLLAPTLGLYDSPSGFTLQAKGTDWALGDPPESTHGMERLFYSPERPDGGRGLLTIRVDKSVEMQSLEAYMQKWNSEYPRYGFEVLGSRTFKLGEQEGYVVDLINKDRDRQMRQVVYFKDQQAVILSCRDDLAHFDQSLKNCNAIMRSFAWKAPASLPTEDKSSQN